MKLCIPNAFLGDAVGLGATHRVRRLSLDLLGGDWTPIKREVSHSEMSLFYLKEETKVAKTSHYYKSRTGRSVSDDLLPATRLSVRVFRIRCNGPHARIQVFS